MTNPDPIDTVNLDQYGDGPLPWSAVAERLEPRPPTPARTSSPSSARSDPTVARTRPPSARCGSTTRGTSSVDPGRRSAATWHTALPAR